MFAISPIISKYYNHDSTTLENSPDKLATMEFSAEVQKASDAEIGELSVLTTQKNSDEVLLMYTHMIKHTVADNSLH